MHASYLHIIQQNLIFEEKIKKGNNFKIKNKKNSKTSILQKQIGCSTDSRSKRRHHFMTLTKQTKAVSN